MLDWCIQGVAGPTLAWSQGLSPADDLVEPTNPSQVSDRHDTAESMRGDEDAFARLVQRHQPGVFHQMWRFSRDPDVVEELVHEVFIEVFKSLKTYRGDAPFIHWLRRIATRVGYRYWKRSARRRKLRQEIDQHYFEIVERPEDKSPSEAAEALYAVLETLAPKDRLVLSLVYFEGCTAREVAERTGWGETGVRVRAHRARKRLRALFENRVESGSTHE